MSKNKVNTEQVNAYRIIKSVVVTLQYSAMVLSNKQIENNHLLPPLVVKINDQLCSSYLNNCKRQRYVMLKNSKKQIKRSKVVVS